MFEILLHDRARKMYERLPLRAARLVDQGFILLEQNPFSGPQIKRLHGELEGCHRLRVASYRIVYHIDRENRRVIVDALGTRGNVY